MAEKPSVSNVTVKTSANAPEDPCSNSDVCGSAVTGLLQMLLGAASVTAGVFILLEDNDWLNIGVAIWCGAIFVIAGLVGFSVCCCRVHNEDAGDHRCMVIGYMALSLIAAIVAAGEVVWESWTSIDQAADFDFCDALLQLFDPNSTCDRLSQWMHITAACAAGVEFLTAIMATIFAGYGACNGSASSPPVVNVNIEIPEQQPQPPSIVNLSVPPFTSQPPPIESKLPYYPAEPYPVVPYPAEPYPAVPYPAVPYPAPIRNSPILYSRKKGVTLYEIEGPVN